MDYGAPIEGFQLFQVILCGSLTSPFTEFLH